MEKIPEIDGLRALAILLVVAWHYVGASSEIGSASLLYKWTIFGRSGVDLFFVLSGFLITSILLRNRSAPNYFATFYARRAFRILPIYYLMVLICTCAVLVRFAPGLFGGDVPLWTYVLGIQNIWMTAHGSYGSVWLAGTWSLAIEEQFYLLFPAIVFLTSLRQLRVLLIAIVAICPLLRIFAWWYGVPLASYGYYVLTPFRADNLAIGALIALHEYRGVDDPTIDRIVSRVMVATAILFPVYAAILSPNTDMHMALWGHTYLGAFYGALLYTVLRRRGTPSFAVLRSRAAMFFARISYALYLVHVCVSLLIAIALKASRDVSTWQGLAVAICAFALSVAICWLSARFFEVPLVRFAHRHFRYGQDGERATQQESPLGPLVPAKAASSSGEATENPV
ncbi:acyltransferase [Bradyrhizobium diazoefficiens]|nr:acyltransferase [Bradyrhizobium diazoefficiens]MBR0846712.1 acyltransferase [Bradyrhizobium diazoefficiens]